MLSRRDFIKSLTSIPIVALGQLSFTKFLWALDAGWAQSADWAGLRNQLSGTGGQLALPTDGAYAAAKKLFNLRLNPNPAAILSGASEEAIQKTILWTAQNKGFIHSRAGGHSYEGFSSGPGLVIDTRAFNKVEVDRDSKTARIGSGALLGNVIQSLFNAGFAIPTGSCATVGVSGLTMGGGMGLSGRQWGLTCDNLKSARVILADGSLVTASETENTDLFWAIRGGGGGSFGVVTEFEFNLKRALDVYTFSFQWSGSQMRRVLDNWQTQIQTGSSQVTSIFKINASNRNIDNVKIVGQVLGRDDSSPPSEDEANTLLRKYIVGNPSATNFKRRSFFEAAQYFAGGEDPPVRFKSKSSYAYKALDSAGMAAIESAVAQVSPGAAVAFLFDSYGGAIGGKANDDTAFFHRKALYCVQYYTQWGDSSQDNTRINMMRQIYQTMNPAFAAHQTSDPEFPGYAYANYCDADLTDPLTSYYGDNLPRLKEIKAQLDPGGLFKNSIQNF